MAGFAAATALAACGSSRPSSPPPPAPPVRLTLTAPSDRASTLADQVYVSGTVSPASADVLIAGRPVTVHGGTFAAHVPLGPGTNVIDVLAGAPRAGGAMTAIRVFRQLPVTVPDLSGASPAAAATELARRRLVAKVVDVGGFLQALIPSSTQVCQTTPAAGRTLAPGSEVQVQVAKLC